MKIMDTIIWHDLQSKMTMSSPCHKIISKGDISPTLWKLPCINCHTIFLIDRILLWFFQVLEVFLFVVAVKERNCTVLTHQIVSACCIASHVLTYVSTLTCASSKMADHAALVTLPLCVTPANRDRAEPVVTANWLTSALLENMSPMKLCVPGECCRFQVLTPWDGFKPDFTLFCSSWAYVDFCRRRCVIFQCGSVTVSDRGSHFQLSCRTYALECQCI